MNAKQLQIFLNSVAQYAIGLVVALIVFAVVVRFIRNRYRGGDDLADDRDQIIRDFRELKRQGEISDEEFRSIKGQISARSNRREAPAKPESETPVKPADQP